jgi:hypothetical protein
VFGWLSEPSNQALLNTELYVAELLASEDRVMRNLLTLEMNMLYTSKPEKQQ